MLKRTLTRALGAALSLALGCKEAEDSAAADIGGVTDVAGQPDAQSDGSDASDGSDGSDTSDSDGSDGSDSTDGTDGSDGSDTTDTTDGSDGSDASDGTPPVIYEKPAWFPTLDSAPEKAVALSGLSAPARVVYDSHGIPHIYAANIGDLFHVQGYVMAKHRLFQMHSLRMAGSGRLAELLGSNSLTGDVFLRLLKLRATAEKIAADMQVNHPEEYASLQRFCDGVNTFIQEVKDKKVDSKELATETSALGVKEPWTPVDSMTAVRFLTYDLGFGSVLDEDELAAIASTLEAAWKDTPLAGVEDDVIHLVPPAKVATVTLDAGKPGNGPVKRRLSEELGKVGARVSKAQAQRVIEAKRDLATMPHHFFRDVEWGSNNWVVSGKHTKSGKPILSNDPHLALRNPSTFFQVHLNTKEAGGNIDLSGVIFAGVPGIVLGTNGTLSMAATVFYGDATDQYVETFTPDGKGVVFKGATVPLEIRAEKFTFPKADPECDAYAGSWVKGVQTKAEKSADGVFCTVTVEFEEVPHHGPLVPWTLTKDENGVRSGLSLRWTGFEVSHEIVAFQRAFQTDNWTDWKAAMDHFGVGSQNFMYADTAGNIGWYPTHRLPTRDNAKLYPPYLPLPGGGEAEWTGDVPRSELPVSYNPESGVLVTANSDPRGYSFDGDVMNDGIYVNGFWDAGFRTARSTERVMELVAQGNIVPEDMIAAQADKQSALGVRLRDALVEALDRAASGKDERAAAHWKAEFAPLRDLLAGWDLEATSGATAADGSPEAESAASAAVFNVWVTYLIQTVLNEKEGLSSIGDRLRVRLILAMVEAPENMVTFDTATQDSRLWDLVATTDAVETRAEVMTLAFAQAVAFLSDPEKIGPKQNGGFGTADVNAWRWGKLHTLTFKHNLVAQFNVPSPAAYPDGYPRPGDNFGVDASSPGMNDRNFTYTHGPAIRHVMELTEPVSRYGALPGGQSEAPHHKHYSDQAPLWLENQAPKIPYATSDVVGAKTRIEDYAP